MTNDLWTRVDDYLANLFAPADPALEETLRTSEAAGLPAIHVSATQGKLLQLLAQMLGAKSILEIGTLGGYSTLWLARALPASGLLITLEYEPKHARIAQANINHAGFGGIVEIRTGSALETLPRLAAEGEGPFDLIFIDADKQNYPSYFEWALKLARPGGLIVLDNIVRDGAVIDEHTSDERVAAVRQTNAMIARESRVSATALQTVGGKGYDGIIIARVNTV